MGKNAFYRAEYEDIRQQNMTNHADFQDAAPLSIIQTDENMDSVNLTQNNSASGNNQTRNHISILYT